MTDRYQVVQSNDGALGIPRGVNFPKIQNTPCQNPYLKCQPKLVDFSMNLTYADAGLKRNLYGA